MVPGTSKVLWNLDLAVSLGGSKTRIQVLGGLMRVGHTVWYPGKIDGAMLMRHSKRQETETYIEDFK